MMEECGGRGVFDSGSDSGSDSDSDDDLYAPEQYNQQELDLNYGMYGSQNSNRVSSMAAFKRENSDAFNQRMMNMRVENMRIALEEDVRLQIDVNWNEEAL